MKENLAIEALKEGNLEGLETLTKMYYHQAVKAAFLIVRSKGEAEDIVQDSFLRAVEKISQCKPGRFRPWFHRIVVNAAIKSVQKRNRLISFEQPARDSQAPLEEILRDPQPGQQATLEANELTGEIWKGMLELPARQRAAIVLKYYLDQSEAGISAIMNWPVSTVKWLLFSARKRLKAQLHAALADPQPTPQSRAGRSETEYGESR